MSMPELSPKPVDPVLREIVERIVTVYKPLRIYLFGSRAQGSARSDSDYDLLVVVPDDCSNELKSAGKAYRILWGITVPVDIVIWTESDFEKRLHLQYSLPAEVVRQGQLLHAA